MVTDTLRFLQMHQKVETVVVDIPYPLTSAQQMVDAVSQKLADVGEVRMCIFSHISSMVSSNNRSFQRIMLVY